MQLMKDPLTQKQLSEIDSQLPFTSRPTSLQLGTTIGAEIGRAIS